MDQRTTRQTRKTVTRRGTTAIGILMVIALVAAACAKSSSNSSSTSTSSGASDVKTLPDEGTPTKGGKMVVGVTAETNGWNPASSQWADAGTIVGSSFLEPLAVFDDQGDFHPWLAESWSASSDNQTWTIKLKQGIKFQDGAEMTSEDVKASFDYTFFEGLPKVLFSGIVTGVDAPDKYTLVVHMSFPWAVFPTVLAGGSGWVMSKKMIDSPDHGANDPIGTGPYEFQSWTPDKSLTVEKFPEYWGGPCARDDIDEGMRKLCDQAGVPQGQPNGPFLDQMVFRPIPDAQERANALKTGDVNMIMSTSAENASTFKANYQVVKDYESEQTFVMLNTGQAPFDNVHARRALAYATDRKAVVDRVDFGEGVKSDTSPFEESSPWGGKAPDQTGYPAFDQEKAKQELTAYTQDTGQPTLRFALSGLATVDDIATMQQVQDQWRQVGIETTIDTIEQSAFIIKLTQGDYQAAYFRSYGYPEPDFDYVFWAKKTAQPPLFINFSQYYDDVTENALATGRTSADRQVRQAAYDTLVKDRNEQAIDIWLNNTPYALIADNNVRGLNWFRTVPFGNYDPKPWVGGMWRTS